MFMNVFLNVYFCIECIFRMYTNSKKGVFKLQSTECLQIHRKEKRVKIIFQEKFDNREKNYISRKD